MSNLPPVFRTRRLTIWIGLTAFAVGFIVVSMILALLVACFLARDSQEWETLNASRNVILISTLGGLGSVVVSIWLLNRFRQRRAVRRCQHCSRSFKEMGYFCECPESQALDR